MIRSIVWFKTDLRLHDNETLIKAIEQSDEIIPVYCFDESHFKMTDFGFNKTGNFRTQFLIQSVTNLKENLQALHSDLLILIGNPVEELSKIVKYYDVQKVFAKKEVAYEEKQIEECVEKELWKLHCLLETYSTSTLYQATDLPFTIKDIPDVFTSFRKKVEKESTIRDLINPPDKIKSPKLHETMVPSLQTLHHKSIEIDSRLAILFKGGETEALNRLEYYFHATKSILHYKETRNGMVGDLYSTKFSAWLALGCISSKKIIFELSKFEKLYQANDSTYWLLFELLWRDYFRFMMKKHRNKFFLQCGFNQLSKEKNNHNVKNLQKWIQGNTGNDFIDANMIELKQTGYMSNRGRQNVASYLCNDLKLDWRYGAAYFEQQLIDYDVCSNWGNWAYLAGVGNDPRGNRYFNIEKQAAEYDTDSKFRRLWLNKN